MTFIDHGAIDALIGRAFIDLSEAAKALHYGHDDSHQARARAARMLADDCRDKIEQAIQILERAK